MAKRSGETVEEIRDKLKRMFSLNMLVPGQRLVYRDLAEKLNTSTTPIIQALRALEHSGLVRHDHNKGYYVEEMTIKEAEELFLAREALEIVLLPDVVQNLNEGTIGSIRQRVKDYQYTLSPDHRRGAVLRDAKFHLLIAECAGNKVIYSLLEQIFERISLKYTPEYQWESRVKEVIKQHKEILEALSKGKAAETQKLMRSHIREGQDHVIASLKSVKQMEGDVT